MKMPTSRKARIEYLAIEKNAEDLFQKGHSFRSAYRIFYESHKITMSYDTFRRYALGLFTRMEQRREKYTEHSDLSAPAPESSKSAEDNAASLPAKQPSGGASSDKAASAPAMSEQANAPARSGPRIVGGQKPVPFGEIKVDLDKAYGIESEKE